MGNDWVAQLSHVLTSMEAVQSDEWERFREDLDQLGKDVRRIQTDLILLKAQVQALSVSSGTKPPR